jgi:lipopolysaccharide/colanic/teichoic acid biosynthesis glycosyltransferase
MARRNLVVAVALDVAALIAALIASSQWTFGQPNPWAARPGSTTMLAALFGGGLAGLYLAYRPAAEGPYRPSYGRVLSVAGVMLGTTAVAVVLTRAFWSRAYVLTATATWLGLALAHRWVRRRRPWTESMVLITSEKALTDDLLGSVHANVIAVLDPSGAGPDEPPPPGTTIAIDLRSVLSDEMARFVSSSSIAGYPMRSLVSTYEEHTGRLPIIHLMEGWELTIPLLGNRGYVRLKRIVDTMLVLATAPITIAFGLLLALAIKLESPRGAVLFHQERVGLEGKPFTLHKFRTMRVGSGVEAQFAAKADDRLTRVGRVIRRIRFDELPQLWNVLRGELSLVGPRPEQEPFVERFTDTIPFYGHRHLVRPGLTGWSQVNFGYADSEADTVEKLSYDLYYVKHVSPWLDLEVLGRSVWTVISGFGAR